MSRTPFSYTAAIITGGSSGIGATFIDSILKIERNTLICNLSRTKPSKFSLSGRFFHIPCDLTKKEVIEGAVNEIKSILATYQPVGPVLVINNSGYGTYGCFQDIDLSTSLGMIDLNIRAVVELTGRLLPLLIGRGGAIMNIASAAAFQPTPYIATYGASKAFILNWSLALREDLKMYNIPVLAVCPGPTKSRFSERAGFNLSIKSQSSEVVVEASLKALASGKSFIIPGVLNKLLVCMGRLLPLNWATSLASTILNKTRRSKK